MHPIGWKDMSVPSSAPIRDTRLSKTGIALAMMYAITVMLSVHPSQVSQWMGEFEARCLDPRRMRMKMIFAGSYYSITSQSH